MSAADQGMATTVIESEDQHSGQGLIYGLGAYGLWGLIPLYFRLVRHVAPLEVLAHRAAWSFVVLVLIVAVSRRWSDVRKSLTDFRTVLMLGLSTLMIAINWLTFIYAVASGQLLQASLGYFVTPLVNVLLGVVVLGESLRPSQKGSIALAALGVLVLAVMVGTLPWIAILLALSFSLYGLLRKTMPVAGLVGLMVETLAMTPLALLYLGYRVETGTATATDAATWGLLSLSGVITSVPLLLFVGAARRLRLSTLGILQYLSPTLQFLLAVFAFGEPFSMAQVASFLCTWAAVGLYATDALAVSRAKASESRVLEVVEPD